ncbi:MAG: hypothetical protein HPY44_20345 [Armatimonadetes bacterium]|nr:hypothetical protein [Armatimonadota bacterium]
MQPTDGELRAAEQWANRVIGVDLAGLIFSLVSEGTSLEPASREQAAVSEGDPVRSETIRYHDPSSGLGVEVEARIHSVASSRGSPPIGIKMGLEMVIPELGPFWL